MTLTPFCTGRFPSNLYTVLLKQNNLYDEFVMVSFQLITIRWYKAGGKIHEINSTIYYNLYICVISYIIKYRVKYLKHVQNI